MHSLKVITLLYAKYTRNSVLTKFYYVRYLQYEHHGQMKQQTNGYEQYNEKMKHFSSENVQELKTVLVPLAATMRTMDNYNALLYDDIHFNDHLGLPLLKNTLLSFLLLTSDGNLKVTGQQSHWRRNQYYNDRRYTNRSNQNFNQQPFRFTNNQQSYNYMRSF